MTFRDWIMRTYLDCKSAQRYKNNTVEFGDFRIPPNYKSVFVDTFSRDYKENWESGSSWWGQPYHPGNLIEWYDDEQIVQGMDMIELRAVKKSKNFIENGSIITKPNAVGNIRSKMGWKYGIYIISAKMPRGKWLWPALWFSGIAHWPPEIDLVEAYSENTENYEDNKHITTNIHWGSGDQQDDYGARWHRMPNDVINEYIEYTLWWEADFIKIYYNGYLVLSVTNRTILDGMFEEMQIIIGNGFEKENTICRSPLYVNSVEIYQK